MMSVKGATHCALICAGRLLGHGDTLEDAIRDYAELYGISSYEHARARALQRDVLVLWLADADTVDAIADDDGIVRDDWLHTRGILYIQQGDMVEV